MWTVEVVFQTFMFLNSFYLKKLLLNNNRNIPTDLKSALKALRSSSNPKLLKLVGMVKDTSKLTTTYIHQIKLSYLEVIFQPNLF